MATTAADRIPAAGTWTLAAVEPMAGECSCCYRRITQRVFRVTHPAHGEMWLGRKCAAVATGYNGKLENALRMAYRSEEIDARDARLAAAYPLATATSETVSARIRAERDEYGTEFPPPRGTAAEIAVFHALAEARVVDALWSQRGPDGEITDELRDYLCYHGITG